MIKLHAVLLLYILLLKTAKIDLLFLIFFSGTCLNFQPFSFFFIDVCSCIKVQVTKINRYTKQFEESTGVDLTQAYTSLIKNIYKKNYYTALFTTLLVLRLNS